MTGRNALTDVLGQLLRRKIKLTGRYSPDHFDHSVGADEKLYRLLFQQVISNANLCGFQAVAHEDYLHDGRIQNDVPVIGHGQIPAVQLLDILYSVIGKVLHSGGNDPLNGLGHHYVLEIVHRFDTSQKLCQKAGGLIREDETGNPGSVGMIGQTG